jgi:hypothetical protein
MQDSTPDGPVVFSGSSTHLVASVIEFLKNMANLKKVDNIEILIEKDLI